MMSFTTWQPCHLKCPCGMSAQFDGKDQTYKQKKNVGDEKFNKI